MAASAAAIQVASSHTDGTPGMQNAIRHFVWQAYIAGRHGVAVAEAVAAAHEEGRDTPHDTRVDLHNNAVGREYGAAHSADDRPGVAARRPRPAGRGREAEVGGGRADLGQGPLTRVSTPAVGRGGAPSTSRIAAMPACTSAYDVDSGERPIRRPPGSR